MTRRFERKRDFDGNPLFFYSTAAPFEKKDVLVVGLENSALDIAIDLYRCARSVSISTRRNAWIMPKYQMGVSCRPLVRSLKLCCLTYFGDRTMRCSTAFSTASSL
jgi:hypothetical protein